MFLPRIEPLKYTASPAQLPNQMAELRQQTSSEGMSLEDLFLKLTGGHQTQRLDTVFDA